MHSQKVPNTVTPAEAGVQNSLKSLDSRLRGNDDKGFFSTFYRTINFQCSKRLSAGGGLNFGHWNLPFDVAQDREPVERPVEPFGICVLGFGI